MKKGLGGEERRGREQARGIEEEMGCNGKEVGNRNQGQREEEKINTASASQEEGMRTEEIGSHPMAT